jgi:hypothetical protein
VDKTDKDVTRKGKIELKKDTTAINCLWHAAEWLGQYSKILENLRPVTPVR